jgi:hypothetical protein
MLKDALASLPEEASIKQEQTKGAMSKSEIIIFT